MAVAHYECFILYRTLINVYILIYFNRSQEGILRALLVIAL
jgi:hypothetical protein